MREICPVVGDSFSGTVYGFVHGISGLRHEHRTIDMLDQRVCRDHKREKA